MTKFDFALALYEKLDGLPQEELEERVNFYVEMIEDRMEDGLSEEEAVAAIGTADEIAAQILADVPLTKIIKGGKVNRKKLTAREWVFIAVGSPVWLPVAASLAAAIISVYASLWAAVISLWACPLSFAAGVLSGVLLGIYCICTGNVLTGFAGIGAALVCAGLSILTFYALKTLTKGYVMLTKKLLIRVFRRSGREKA